MIDSRYYARNAIFSLGQQGSNEIDLVITGRSDKDLTLVEGGAIEGRDFTGISK